MDGITIHAEHVYRATSVFTAVIATVFLLFIAALTVYNTVIAFKTKSSSKWVALIFSIISIIVTVVALMIAIVETQIIRTELIVTIDDSVGFNEFNERYEIISKDGSLYTIRELPIKEEVG